MASFPFIQFIVAFTMLLLMWSLRKLFVKFFTKKQEITLLGDMFIGILMVIVPSFVLYWYESYQVSLLANVLILGFTYELYGFLLYKIEKIDNVGALSYFRKRIANA